MRKWYLKGKWGKKVTITEYPSKVSEIGIKFLIYTEGSIVEETYEPMSLAKYMALVELMEAESLPAEFVKEVA